MGEINIAIKNKVSNYTASIIFLIVVLIITVSLHFYNYYVWNEVEKIKTNISSIDASISSVEKDKRLQVYTLLELNKELISSYEKMNDITKYINHMNVIGSKYKLKFDGFNFAKWEISSTVNIVSDIDWIAFLRTKDFINKYRVDQKALFELKFINSVDWMDDMKFKVNFKVK